MTDKRVGRKDSKVGLPLSPLLRRTRRALLFFVLLFYYLHFGEYDYERPLLAVWGRRSRRLSILFVRTHFSPILPADDVQRDAFDELTFCLCVSGLQRPLMKMTMPL